MAYRIPARVARDAMRRSTVEGAVATASENVAGPFVSLFAAGLGASKAEIGLLAAVPALVGNLLQLPAAALTEALGRRRGVVVLGALGARAMWLPLVLLPFAFPREPSQGPPAGEAASPWPQAAVWTLLVILTVRAMVGSLVSPAWTSLMADLVPPRRRGAYFSNRNMLCNGAALLATLAGGWLIRTGGFPLGYQLIFGAAFLLGVGSALLLTGLPDPPLGAGRARTGLRWIGDALAELREEPVFRRYCLSALLWNFAVTLPAPLFSVYYVTQLGGTEAGWGVVTAANQLVTLACQRYWGRLSHTLGERALMVVGGLGASLLPLFWFLAPSAPWAAPSTERCCTGWRRPRSRTSWTAPGSP